MLSIRTKRKVSETSKHSADSLKNDAHPKRDQLIDGSFELIDLLYQYISKDGVGLTYVQNSIAAGKYCEDFFENLTHYFECIESATSALTSTTMQLHNIICAEMDSYGNVCNVMEQSHNNNCEINAALNRMKELLSQSESYPEAHSPEFSSFLSQMQSEIAILESKQTATRNLFVQIFTEYQQKVDLVTTSIDQLLIQLKQEIAMLKEKEDLQCDFSNAKEKNAYGLQLLDQREHDNMIMLNDLISFLVQLKSILTCLKDEFDQ